MVTIDRLRPAKTAFFEGRVPDDINRLLHDMSRHKITTSFILDVRRQHYSSTNREETA